MNSYLPEDAKERLAHYVYRGEDHSYLYNHMWRPLCRSVVRHLPVWLAPNVITVTALVLVSITHALLAYYMPKLTVKETNYLDRDESRRTGLPFAKEFLPPPPAYVLVLAAVALFLYQLLDNLDGHQARRTGTSSPLGLLMDHGCDAVNCVIGGLSVAAVVSAGPCWKTWTITLSTVIVFFLNTWEEYYRGVLVLPVINGPNEGIVIAIGVYLWTAWVGGPQWWVDNTLEVPTRWLPRVLRQSPPQAAVAIENYVLRTVCPYLTSHNDDDGGFAAVPFFFNLNCSSAYIAHPPRPTRVLFAPDPVTARYEEAVAGSVWAGHGWVQRTVLRLYGGSQEGLRIRYNTLGVAFMTVTAAMTCAGNVYQVYRAIRRASAAELAHEPGYGRFHARFPFLHALSKLIPLVVITLMGNVWFLTSQEDVFRRHPRLFCWTVGLLYTKLAIHLMVSHLCGAEFFPFPRTFVPFVLFGGHICLTYLHNVGQLRRQQLRSGGGGGGVAHVGHVNRSGSRVPTSATGAYSDYAYDLDEELILYEFFALSVVTFAHLVWNVVRGTAAVLEVPVFTVPLQKQVALRTAIAAEKAERANSKQKPETKKDK
ncbi:putative aminoalcohol phosphotransferase [Leptomonas pyrrhocoris]|uniref:Putative aminoalcohol phosphotransferase n=1 Tax=Leptomonas pyrrhocoris TaxID=157538 RepID=A0A0M9FPS1_LEPPY|nr:putative aminoalcohol phosphotransferase [Leptomonas pyrrhocoris]KPA73429.1 putative aminoalcohol phosphotransferase [Leptomonas pyrrhocoris]|eukprot:XP_015651868.1 putative aminoalcohol phosphotransferase [Leptomonas pyrrhocoris]